MRDNGNGQGRLLGDGVHDAARDALAVPLAGLDRRAIAVCGGKAANLGELIGAGFPVPAGFCVTTRAYTLATDMPALAEVHAQLAGTPPTDAARLEQLAARARELVLGAPIPAAVREACSAAYNALGDGVAVAVRSSATAEDLPDASFAGQQDTFLDVSGTLSVVEAVQRCWASLWTDRAVAYRARNGIDPASVRLAVVVQRMVEARVAGVLFTADPITGKRGRTVLDAAPGLGEAVVSGAVNPDHFEVDTASWSVESRRIPGAEPCLRDAEVLLLARLGAKVEGHYGAPQDIEWAIDDDEELWVLQSRPITTLFPLPDGATEGGAHVYLSFNVAQGVLQPFTPMGLSAWRLMTGALSEKVGFPLDDPERGMPLLHEAASRLFLDFTPLARDAFGRKVLSFAFHRMEARSEAMLDALFADPRFAVVPSSRLGLLRYLARVAARTRIPVTLVRFVAAPEGVPAYCRRIADEALALGHVGPEATGEDWFAAAKRVLTEGPGEVLPALVPAMASGMLCWLLAKRLIGDLATAAELETCFRGLRNNPTTEMDLALWGLAVKARRDPESLGALRTASPQALSAAFRAGALPALLEREVRAFLAEYGARGVAEIDLGVPRWRDDPAHLFGALSNYVAHDPGAAAPDEQFARVEREAAAMARELSARVRERDRVRGEAVAFLLSRMRALAGLREAPKFYVVRLLGRARELLAEVGRELASEGRLGAAEDVFMLGWDEVRAGLAGRDHRALVAERRVELAREKARRRLPRVLLSDGTEPEGRAAPGDAGAGAGAGAGRLRGTPASAGRITGRARVILEPNGARLEKGEILVAPSTDPGWTPLFLTAGGLVMEMGGSMSHGAVVAREYGIPAVVGVARATEEIASGQTITVDGGAGEVSLGVSG